MFFYQCCFVYISNGVTDFLLAMIDDVITGGRSLILCFLLGPVETGPEVNASPQQTMATTNNGHNKLWPQQTMATTNYGHNELWPQ